MAITMPHFRRIRFLAPIHIRHRVLNGVGHVCKAADAIFGTKLHERLKSARVGAVINLPPSKKPYNLRRVWEEFRHDGAETPQT